MNLQLPAAALLFLALLAGPAQAQTCNSDEDCQDGSWCNGTERCEGHPTKGMCMPAQRPMCSDKKICDEDGKRCSTATTGPARSPAGAASNWNNA